ncbi:MAG: RluA family pseudouridine synthase [Clostridia bacterium]|nr:RluA family pseudouridine synthase [Clostridia bacterium]
MDNQEIIVTKEHDGERIDAFVSNVVENFSRSLAQSFIKEEKILIDGKVVKVSTKVREGQKVKVPIKAEKEVSESLIAEDIPIDILYEDDDILVINKPKNMVVHPAVGNKTGTLVNAILGKTQLSNYNGEFRPGIVHRLDKDTTGVLVVAKNNMAHQNIAEQIQNRETKKIYIALVRGLIKEDNGVIDLPIGRHPTDRKKMAVVKEGKQALTHFKVLKRLDGYTLIEIELKTGRTHQIRVHMSHIGHPVVGDNVYSSGKNPFGATSQMLHAYKLGFKHPKTGEWMEFTAPLPKEFEKIM